MAVRRHAHGNVGAAAADILLYCAKGFNTKQARNAMLLDVRKLHGFQTHSVPSLRSIQRARVRYTKHGYGAYGLVWVRGQGGVLARDVREEGGLLARDVRVVKIDFFVLHVQGNPIENLFGTGALKSRPSWIRVRSPPWIRRSLTYLYP